MGESRFLYVRTRGNIAEALSYNLLMYRGGHMGKKGILSNLYGVCEYIDFVVKNRLKKASRQLKSTTTRHFPTDLHRGFYFPPSDKRMDSRQRIVSNACKSLIS